MKSGLAYLGVAAPFPPNFRYEDRAPTPNDYAGFVISEIWLVKYTEDIYMLTDKRNKVSTWTLLTGGSGSITQVDGGTNVTTVNATGPTVTVNLDDNIVLAGDLTLTAGDATIASLAEGVVQSDSSGLLFANSGADGQVMIGNTSGAPAWHTLTSSDGTVVFSVGPATLDLRSTGGGGGGGLTSMPTDSGTATVSGTGTIDVLGGTNLNTVASGASVVSINLDNDVGVSGYLQAGTTVTAGTDLISTGATTVGTTLTVSSLGLGVVQSSASGVFSSSVGTVGQLLISSGSGAPAWANLTAGTNVTIDDTTSPGQITISSSGGAGGVSQVDGGTNITTVNPTGPTVTVNLDNNVSLVGSLTAGTSVTATTSIVAGTTISATGNIDSVSGSLSAGTTVTAGTDLIVGSDATINGNLITPAIGPGVAQISSLGQFSASEGTDGQLLIGSHLGAPTWANITSTSGTVAITNGPNTINIEAIGGGGGVLAGDNLNIAPAGTMNLNKSISQPVTNASATEGMYSLGGSDFMHNYGTYNTFLGVTAGNRTLTSQSCTGIGYNALTSVTSGRYCVAVGDEALRQLTVSDSCTAIGHHALRNFAPSFNEGSNVAIGTNALGSMTEGRNTIAIGYNAGANLTTSTRGNICIGHTGTAGMKNAIYIGTDAGEPAYPNRCYIAGIYGTAPNSATHPRIMEVGDDNILGISYGKALGTVLMGGGSYATPRFGTLTSSSGTINIDSSTPGTINIESTGASLSAFRAYQSSNIANMTGDGTTYWLGANVALSEEYDIGSDFYPGSGSGSNAYFSAPITGLYNFTLSILLTNLENPPPSPPAVIYIDPLSIVTSSKTYQLINPALVYKGEQTLFYTVYARMTAGDIARFNCSIVTDAGTKTIGIGATHTWIGGFLVSAGI
jgi:hypothetical protein